MIKFKNPFTNPAKHIKNVTSLIKITGISYMLKFKHVWVHSCSSAYMKKG